MPSENLHMTQGDLGRTEASSPGMVPGSLAEAAALVRRMLDEERAVCYWCGLALGVLVAGLLISLLALT